MYFTPFVTSSRWVVLALVSAFATFTADTLAQRPATDPVGIVKETFSGSRLVSAPVWASVAAQAPLDSVNAAKVGFPNVPALGTSHFLLVLDGPAKGAVRTILAVNGDLLTLETAISDLAAGHSVKLIEHFTLGHLQAASGGTMPNNTTCTIYNIDGSRDVYSSSGGNWYDNNFAISDDIVILPGEGVVMSFASETTLSYSGVVNIDEFSIQVSSSAVNLVASGNPTAPIGAGSIGEALSALVNNSTVTLYSEDGQLTRSGTYSLSNGVWYNSDFAPVDISQAAPGAVVVAPGSSQSVLLSPAL